MAGLADRGHDPAQDTFILYNNRRVLERMLNVPLEDRFWGRSGPMSNEGHEPRQRRCIEQDNTGEARANGVAR